MYADKQLINSENWTLNYNVTEKTFAKCWSVLFFSQICRLAKVSINHDKKLD